jgi:hypothetical protein
MNRVSFNFYHTTDEKRSTRMITFYAHKSRNRRKKLQSKLGFSSVPDPDPFVRGIDPDPTPEPSIIKKK